jgi:hypothetical protein
VDPLKNESPMDNSSTDTLRVETIMNSLAGNSSMDRLKEKSSIDALQDAFMNLIVIGRVSILVDSSFLSAIHRLRDLL